MQIQLNLELPDMANLTEHDLRMYLSTKLYEEGRLPLGYCADVAGLSKRTFAELLGRYGVPFVTQTNIDEIKQDIENACKYAQ